MEFSKQNQTPKSHSSEQNQTQTHTVPETGTQATKEKHSKNYEILVKS